MSHPTSKRSSCTHGDDKEDADVISWLTKKWTSLFRHAACSDPPPLGDQQQQETTRIRRMEDKIIPLYIFAHEDGSLRALEEEEDSCIATRPVDLADPPSIQRKRIHHHHQPPSGQQENIPLLVRTPSVAFLFAAGSSGRHHRHHHLPPPVY